MTKKLLLVIAIMLSLICVLTSCGECEHEWTEQTCVEGSHCAKCGEEASSPKGHSFNDATCTEPQTCSVCGATGDGPLGHTSVTQNAVSATCTTTGTNAGTKCTVCSEILSGCEEIAKIPHSTRFGFCSACDQLITELLPEANNLLDKLSIADDAVSKVNDKLNAALKLGASSIPNALNTAFSYIEPAKDALLDAYLIVDSYDEFSNLKSDLETLYGVVLYIKELHATSSNFISISYEFVAAATLYWEAKEVILSKLAAYMS